jgi:hypothetical protein
MKIQKLSKEAYTQRAGYAVRSLPLPRCGPVPRGTARDTVACLRLGLRRFTHWGNVDAGSLLAQATCPTMLRRSPNNA